MAKTSMYFAKTGVRAPLIVVNLAAADGSAHFVLLLYNVVFKEAPLPGRL